MARPVVVSISASGTSNPIPLNYHLAPFNVAIGVVPTSGTPSITIQHTFNYVYTAEDAAAAHWFDHEALTNVSVTTDGNYAFPVNAIRIVSDTAGDAVVYVIQAGIAL